MDWPVQAPEPPTKYSGDCRLQHGHGLHERLATGGSGRPGTGTAGKTSDIPPGNTQWGSYVEEVKKSGADTVYVPLAGLDLFGFLSALKQAGVTGQ